MLILEHEGSSKGTAGGPKWSGTISIEHVLPRNLKNEKAGWLLQPQGWNNHSQAQWLHRLGNLALLNDSDNSSLGNVSFREKVLKMQAFGHASSWTIKDLLEHHKDRAWDQAAVQSRHTRLLEMLRSRWETEKIAFGLTNQGPSSTKCTRRCILCILPHSHTTHPGVQLTSSFLSRKST